jgi:hypothetical protein
MRLANPTAMVNVLNRITIANSQHNRPAALIDSARPTAPFNPPDAQSRRADPKGSAAKSPQN